MTPRAIAARDQAAELARLERIANRMDRFLRIPGTGIRLGFDSILGLLPGIGDAAALAPASYIILKAHRLGAPAPLVGRMVLHTGVDALLGSIPLLGDLFDLANKSNSRNVALLRAHLQSKGAALSDSPRLVSAMVDRQV